MTGSEAAQARHQPFDREPPRLRAQPKGGRGLSGISRRNQPGRAAASAGAVAEFDKAMTVAKLRGARERKRRKNGKCEGRKTTPKRMQRRC